MTVLIVEGDPNLAWIWRQHLQRAGFDVIVAEGQVDAVDVLQRIAVEIVVLDLDLGDGSALAVADFTCYRRPGARVVFVTKSSFFSDGSLFRMFPNAAAFMPSATPPDDLTAIVEHHALAG